MMVLYRTWLLSTQFALHVGGGFCARLRPRSSVLFQMLARFGLVLLGSIKGLFWSARGYE